jgi:predicted RNase H-like nuclease (RuvC/YqgF family)
MSDTLLITLATIIASIISVALTQLVGYWIAKKKTASEINQIDVNADAMEGELAERYLTIAERQAKINTELNGINMELKKKVEALESDVEELKKARITDREEFRKAFEEEREKTELYKNYNDRLISQLSSWAIVPVPLDVIGAKDLIKKNCIDGAEIQR